MVPGAVILARQAEHGRIGSGLLGVVDRERAPIADQHDELRHRRAEPAALVGLVDVVARGQDRLAVR
jgi:hypothetical protein